MTSLLQKINTLDTKVDGLDSSNLQTQIDTNTTDITTLQTSKQNTIIAGDNITITGDTISSSGGGTIPENATFTSVNTGTLTSGPSTFSNTPIEITDQAVNITSQLIVKGNTFDTILIRRISGDTTLNLRETQLWINDVNVFINNTNPSQNQDGLLIGDTVEFVKINTDGTFSTRNALQTYFASNAVNDIIGDNFDTHTESADNASLYIPLTSTFNLGDIQSFVIYNRTFSTTGQRSIGLQLQVYNRVDDPSLSNPLVISNTITEDQPVYRFDFPAINTYSGFVSSDSTQFITTNALISTDLTFAAGQEPEVAIGLKIVDGRLEMNQEISTKNVVVTDTTPIQNNELTSKAYVDTLIDANTNDISTLQTSKQNTLIAGDHITITGDTISSSGGGGTDIGFLAYHNTTTGYSSVQKLPYNLVKYNSGNAYDDTTYIFTVPVAGKYYFYATYFTVSNSGGGVDLILKKVGLTEQTISRGQEGQTSPGTHEKRSVSVVIECEVGDQLYALVQFNTIRLSPGNYASTEQLIYGPFGCQLLT